MSRDNLDQDSSIRNGIRDSYFDWKRYIIMLLIVVVIFMSYTALALSVENNELRNKPTTTVVNCTHEVDPNPVDPIIPETEETIPEVEPDPTPEPPSDPETEDPKPTINQAELEMLACVIYQEAGGNGSCDDCRKYVADVVLNRMEHEDFPDTMYEVLTSKGQYGRFYWTGIVWPARANHATEAEAVERAYETAEAVLSGEHSKLYGKGYIWQAGFVQGTDGFWCCGHWYGR